MAGVAEILKDPNFRGLPLEERRKVLVKVDGGFGQLPAPEQDKVLNVTLEALEPPKAEPAAPDNSAPVRAPEGFLENAAQFVKTGVSDIAGLPHAASYAVQHPGMVVHDWWERSKAALSKAKDLAAKGEYEKAGREAQTAIPLIGPMVAGIEDDIDSKNYGAALARMGEMVIGHRAGESPGRTASAVKGGAGYVAEKIPGKKFTGGLVDAMRKSAKDWDYRNRPAPGPRANPPAWKEGMPGGVAPEPVPAPVDPIPGDLPSGRRPPTQAEHLARMNPPGTPPTPQRAPVWAGGSPGVEPIPAPVDPIPGTLPSGRKIPTAAERAAILDKPIPAPPVVDPNVVTPADLDAAAVSLGVKNFAAVPDNLKAAVTQLAEKAKQPPTPKLASAPVENSPVPAPPLTEAVDSVKPASMEPPVSSIVEPVRAPRTLEQMLAEDIAAKKAAREAAAPAASAKPIPAPEISPEAASAPAEPIPAPRTDTDLANHIAQQMHEQGFTEDQLHAMSDADRAAALGADVDKFPQIASALREHASRTVMGGARSAKDLAVAAFLKGKGITPEAVEAMDEGTLATHIVDAGYRAPGKSGKLGRTPAGVKRDLIAAMRSGEPVRAPGPTAITAKVPGAAAVSQPLPVQALGDNNGVTATVRTPNQTKAKVRYVISEANDLRTSFDPDYNKEIAHQPRDTSRLASRQRVEQRKLDMDPEAMGVSRMAGDGAPITRGGHAVTRNHGLQAVKENYGLGGSKAAEYKAWVQEQAGLAGLTPEQVAGMKNPVLHRELLDEWDHAQIKKFADEANQSSTARMSEAEVASNMAKRLSGSTMDAFDITDDGVPSASFVRGLIAELPVEEQAQFFDRNAEVSQAGARMVRNAIFAKAYRNVGVIERMAESVDSQVRNITTGMLKAAPETAKLQEAIARGDAQPLDLSTEVGDAVEALDGLRASKKSVDDWLKQEDLLGRDPVVHSLVSILAQESRRPNVIRDTLLNYVRDVEALGNPKQQGMFGPTEIPSKLELVEGAYERARSEADAAAKAAAEKRAGKQTLLGSGTGDVQSGEAAVPPVN